MQQTKILSSYILKTYRLFLDDEHGTCMFGYCSSLLSPQDTKSP
mgnify:CR=1 FL=1